MSKVISMEFISHHVVGVNPDEENGYWDTREKATQYFVTEFLDIVQKAKHKYLFVRTTPQLYESFEGKWKMVGRFSIVKLKREKDDRQRIDTASAGSAGFG